MTSTDLRLSYPASWEPLTLSDEAGHQLASKQPNIPWLRNWLLAAYAAQSGNRLQPKTATNAQLIELAQWLRFQQMENHLNVLTPVWRRLEDVLYHTYDLKINSIKQRRCHICQVARLESDLFFTNVKTVAIKPISRQASEAEVFDAYQATFAKRLAVSPLMIGNTDRICLALTFVLNKNRNDRDLDNMSKAAMDALSRAAGFDDKHVHHLDVVKLILPIKQERIHMRIAPSALNVHDDVVAPFLHESSLGMEHTELPPNTSRKQRNKSKLPGE